MTAIFLGDVHLGVRNDSEYFYDVQVKFFQYVLFPYMKENDIHDIYQFGDLFDRRKHINFATLYKCKRDIFDYMADNNIQFHMVVGNHDIYYRQSNEINSPSLLLREYSNITIHDEFSQVLIDGEKFDLISWICDENRQRILNNISGSNSKYAIGHFELAGFPMYAGIESKHGQPIKFLSHYNKVFSGHYHTGSAKSNIKYISTPYEMTFSDMDDAKGFTVFNGKGLKFIENEDRIHYQIYFDSDIDIDEFDYEKYKNKIVRLNVLERLDTFNEFLERLVKRQPHDLVVNELSVEISEVSDEDLENISTIDIIMNTISGGEFDNKDIMERFCKEIFFEAKQLR